MVTITETTNANNMIHDNNTQVSHNLQVLNSVYTYLINNTWLVNSIPSAAVFPFVDVFPHASAEKRRLIDNISYSYTVIKTKQGIALVSNMHAVNFIIFNK